MTTTTQESRIVRLAIGAIAACLTAVLLYALLRLKQAFFGQEPDPALVIYSAHAGFFWRGWIAAYAGGMVGFIAYIAAGRNASRTVSGLSRCFTIVFVIALAQGLLVP